MSIKKTTKLSKLIFFSLLGLFVGGFAVLRSQDKSGGNYSSILDYDKVYADVPVTCTRTCTGDGDGQGQGSTCTTVCQGSSGDGRSDGDGNGNSGDSPCMG